MTGFKISPPLSNTFTGGFSPNIPGPAPAVVQGGTDAERASRAGHDRDPRLVVVPESGERVVEAAPHLAVDRVQRGGPVVRGGRDVVAQLVFDGVGHSMIVW